MTDANDKRRIADLEKKMSEIEHLAEIEVGVPLFKQEEKGVNGGLTINFDSTAVNPLIAYTSLDFVVPEILSTVQISVTSIVDTSIWMMVGQTVLINGSALINGYVSEIITIYDFVLTVTNITTGAVGDTMTQGAAIIMSGQAVNEGPVIKIVAADIEGLYFDALYEVRDNSVPQWVDGVQVWGLPTNLTTPTTLVVGDRYPAVFEGEESNGSYVCILANTDIPPGT